MIRDTGSKKILIYIFISDYRFTSFFFDSGHFFLPIFLNYEYFWFIYWFILFLNLPFPSQIFVYLFVFVKFGSFSLLFFVNEIVFSLLRFYLSANLWFFIFLFFMNSFFFSSIFDFPLFIFIVDDVFILNVCSSRVVYFYSIILWLKKIILYIFVFEPFGCFLFCS